MLTKVLSIFSQLVWGWRGISTLWKFIRSRVRSSHTLEPFYPSDVCNNWLTFIFPFPVNVNPDTSVCKAMVQTLTTATRVSTHSDGLSCRLSDLWLRITGKIYINWWVGYNLHEWSAFRPRCFVLVMSN